MFFNHGIAHVLVDDRGHVTVKAASGPYADATMKSDGEATLQLSWDSYRREWMTDLRDDEVLGFPEQPYPTMHPVKAVWQTIAEATRKAGW